jgi:hypothetical protein
LASRPKAAFVIPSAPKEKLFVIPSALQAREEPAVVCSVATPVETAASAVRQPAISIFGLPHRQHKPTGESSLSDVVQFLLKGKAVNRRER